MDFMISRGAHYHDANLKVVCDQAQQAVDLAAENARLKARLDAADKICCDEMVARGDMANRNVAYGYNLALAKIAREIKDGE